MASDPVSEPESKDTAVRDARLLVQVAMGLLLLLTLGFHFRLGMGLHHSLFVSLLLAALPLLTLAQLPFVVGLDIERLRAYAGSAATILVLASIALVLGAIGPGAETMGLGAVSPAVLGRSTGLLLLTAGGLVGGFHLATRWSGVSESRLLLELIPRTRPEKRAFAGLALAAGVGEEIVYRGYLQAVLTVALGGPWIAAAAASASFGLLHAYQGPVGIVRTGALGFLFAAAVVLTGSLWAAMLVHAVVDLVGGLWLGPSLVHRRGGSEGSDAT